MTAIELPQDLILTLARARQRLLQAVDSRGAFCGELSSSALSTATAAMALAMSDQASLAPLAANGHAWLCREQNADGGWGDTTDSPSNISTTLLCWSSLGLAAPTDAVTATVARAEAWITEHGGGLSPTELAATIEARYGEDRTFSVPILTTCALAGRLGEDGWKRVPALPFELAACPQRLFHLLELRTVSYALPALIAIGQVRHFHHPTRNPITWLLRQLTRARTLRKLRAIQPTSGGYLEAAPLTSFVVMSLLSMQQTDHPVVEHGLRFLIETVRQDGSWPIDTNLDTWLTSLSVHALGESLPRAEAQRSCRWLLGQQYRQVHPYTMAAPGGWAWTDLTGGVPDADDTAAALLALDQLDASQVDAAGAALGWLCKLANRDGGMPTFCRGFGKLPFDRSSPDITAHALRAWQVWRDRVDARLSPQIERKTCDAIDYLLREQQTNGSFLPLWFGNQNRKDRHNPVYGTSRVILAVAAVTGPLGLDHRWIEAGRRGIDWLLDAQGEDGGFDSIEETALALDALASWHLADRDPNPIAELPNAIERSAAWLCQHTDHGERFPASPIGLYFAQLWYSERLYPLVFTVTALSRALASTNSNRCQQAT